MSALADYREVLYTDPCAYCGEPAEQIDHIEPRANGGADVPMNLTAACRACNAAKRDVELLPFLLRRVDPAAKPAPKPKKEKPAKPPYAFSTLAICVGSGHNGAKFVFPGKVKQAVDAMFPTPGSMQEPEPGDIYRISLVRQDVVGLAA